MKQLSRRQFIQTGLVGAAAITTGFSNMAYASSKNIKIDKEKGVSGFVRPEHFNSAGQITAVFTHVVM